MIRLTSVLLLFSLAMGTSAQAQLCRSTLALPTRQESRARPSPAARAVGSLLVAQATRWLQSTGWSPTEGHGAPESWTLDGPKDLTRNYDPALSYDQDFYDLIRSAHGPSGVNYFARFLSERQAHGQNTHVLDLFGSGFFVGTNPAAQSVTGLRWGAFKPKSQSESLPTFVPTEILGDIWNSATWDQLESSMQTRGIPSLDLVTMNPHGGWKNSPFYASAKNNSAVVALSLIVGQVLRVLSPTGAFYFSIPVDPTAGKLSEHQLLQDLTDLIEERTRFRLVLVAKVNSRNLTYQLQGALIPR